MKNYTVIITHKGQLAIKTNLENFLFSQFSFFIAVALY